MPTDRTDLNLFRVFDAILSQGSLAAASRDLGLTASAVSHALARLRVLLRDELFLPSRDGMMPTARAKDIAPNIRAALALFAGAIEPSPYDPVHSRRVFQIGSSDGISATVLPPLLSHLAAAAPSVRLRVVPIGRTDLTQQLDEGRLDLVLGWFDALPERIARRRLYEEREALVVRQGHPLTAVEPTPKLLLSYPHLVVEFTGTEALSTNGFFNDRGIFRRTWMDRLLLDTLDPMAAEEKATVTLPGYGSVGPVLAVTDLVATMPLRLARRAVITNGLAILAMPYDPLVVSIDVAWHGRNGNDEGLRWMIETIEAVIGEQSGEQG